MLTDLGEATGAAGVRIEDYETLISDTESLVRLAFASCIRIEFINHHATDRTRYTVRLAEGSS